MTRETAPDFSAATFFAWRTPLLPFDELEKWSAELEAPGCVDDEEALAAALQRDRALLRARLQRLIEQPAVHEALWVASPSLSAGLEEWRRNPDGKKGRRAEEALVRYFQRMASRCTPFGLFSGCAVGETGGNDTQLSLAGWQDARRHTRLDMDYLFELTQELGRDPELMRQLEYRPNTSLYRAAGRIRYAEARLIGGTRSYHLVALESSEYLDETLRLAETGATIAELARHLADYDPDGEISVEEASEFIEELIDSQVLVSSLQPLVTGREAIHDLIESLARYESTSAVSRALCGVRGQLAEMDSSGLGLSVDTYRAVGRKLEQLPTKVEMARLFQVDMVKKRETASLGRNVLVEMERGVQLLHRVAGAQVDNDLSRFRQDFVSRYEDSQQVPLFEVLDEENGIGYQNRSAESSPLLDGLAFPPRDGAPTLSWGALHGLLLRKLEVALREGSKEIELNTVDLEVLPTEELPSLPAAFDVLATLAAASPEAVDRGDFRLLVRAASGPSGARLLGRFCHADDELEQGVVRHVREEEGLDPDSVFAEVVHLPEGRVGNILSRPVLRGYEIPFLGRSGAPVERQIPAGDLLVTVSGEQVVLTSRRLGRRIVPRLTSAHNHTNGALNVYRFLCALQTQNVRPGLTWNWGPLESCHFLPRVVSGRLVLSRARWRLTADDIAQLTAGDDVARFRASRAWAQKRGIPRVAVLADGDNELVVDFDNVLSFEAFVALVRKREQVKLLELFPGPEDLCALGPEGRFTHELVVPFVDRSNRGLPARMPAAQSSVQRKFLPGSEWLSTKLYTGSSTADWVLAHAIAPVVHEMTAAGAVDCWFFIRYADPEWHLRLRFLGTPGALQEQVLPRLAAAAAEMLDAGRLWRFEIDVYQREIERYGGGQGIALAEQLFHRDSECVLEILQGLAGDEGARARWLLALRGIDRLLSDLGLDEEATLRLIGQMKEVFAREFEVEATFKKQLADRLRRNKEAIDDVLGSTDPQHRYSAAFAALDRRSRRLRPIAAKLRQSEADGTLTSPVTQVASSFVHMFVNRLVRSSGRQHEVVLYDFLYRALVSRRARQQAVRQAPDSQSAVDSRSAAVIYK